jgi:hypothetical protein
MMALGGGDEMEGGGKKVQQATVGAEQEGGVMLRERGRAE